MPSWTQDTYTISHTIIFYVKLALFSTKKFSKKTGAVAAKKYTGTGVAYAAPVPAPSG